MFGLFNGWRLIGNATSAGGINAHKPRGRKTKHRNRAAGTRCHFEQLEPRAMLAGDFSWSSGAWAVKVTDSGSPGSPAVQVDLPGGTFATGNSLEVYYQVSSTSTPQYWAFLTDGFWRQVSPGAPWGTSQRLFRYRGSNDQACDNAIANHFQVVGVGVDGKLSLAMDYDNDSTVGDRFDVHLAAVLAPPTPYQTVTTATMTVTNVSGRDVRPFAPLHTALSEQWELFGFSSMYVADNLTGTLPAWYDALDSTHRYVGVVNDGANYLNDGYSQSQSVNVSTHDVKQIEVGNSVLTLDHEETVCPHVVVPGYEWYDQLVLEDRGADRVRLNHLYDVRRNVDARLLSATGIVNVTDDLRWAVNYNRNDANMVDGDNVQVKLGMDEALDDLTSGVWRAGGSETIVMQVTSGVAPNNSPPKLDTPTFTASPREGQVVRVTGTFTDRQPLDTHTVIVAWGDGTTSPALVQEVNGAGTYTATHVYRGGGLYRAVVTAADYTSESDDQDERIAVVGAGIQGRVLQIVGTAARDQVTVARSQPGWIDVYASFFARKNVPHRFAAASIGRIDVFLGASDDVAVVTPQVLMSVMIDGGAGDDQLIAGGGRAILLGGSGYDILRGGTGRDLLLGGTGADILTGGGGEDILVAGSSSYDTTGNWSSDTDRQSLWAIFAEWGSLRPRATRQQNIRYARGTPRLNGDSRLLLGLTAFNDAAADRVVGYSAVADWLIQS